MEGGGVGERVCDHFAGSAPPPTGIRVFGVLEKRQPNNWQYHDGKHALQDCKTKTDSFPTEPRGSSRGLLSTATQSQVAFRQSPPRRVRLRNRRRTPSFALRRDIRSGARKTMLGSRVLALELARSSVVAVIKLS